MAGADSYSQLHHNIQGVLGNHKGAVEMVDGVKTGILQSDQTGDPPFVISMNEVCKSQWTAFNNFLGTYYPNQYQKRFTVTKTANLPGGCQGEFGNAIVVRTNVIGDPWPNGAEYPGQGNESEKRKLRCLQLQIFGPAYFACNTHLKNDTVIADGQAAYMFASINQWWAQPGTMVLGDLNLKPNQTSIMTQVYANYIEADHGCPSYGNDGTDTPTAGAGKIDYVFGSKGNAPTRFVNCGANRVYWSGFGAPSSQWVSDHKMLGSNLIWG